MKKVKKTLAVALTFAMTVVMVPQSALAAKKQVKLNKKSVSVAVGKTVKVKLKNNKKKVKWTVVSGKKNVYIMDLFAKMIPKRSFQTFKEICNSEFNTFMQQLIKNCHIDI